MIQRLARGLAAGCVGLVALEIASYVDMGLAGRPASDSPARLGEQLARRIGLSLGDGEEARNRASALGSLAGYADGFGLGLAYGAVVRHPGAHLVAGSVLLSAGAWLGSNWPLLALGISDPRSWSREEWQRDVPPHVAYGIATAVTCALLAPAQRGG
jgi:phage tail tape-measure protein